jgi:hypothetical protein
LTGAPIMELTAAHADGTIYVDGEGDLWSFSPFLGTWLVTRQVPFAISSQPEAPLPKYGPYVAVIGPPERH